MAISGLVTCLRAVAEPAVVTTTIRGNVHAPVVGLVTFVLRTAYTVGAIDRRPGLAIPGLVTYFLAIAESAIVTTVVYR